MKNKEINKQSLEEKYGITVLTEENKHLFGEEIEVAYDKAYDENAKHFFSKKYFPAQKDMLLTKTKEFYQISPDLPLKLVLLKIMEPLPDFLPADNLVEVTKIITSTWVELQQKVAA